MPDTAQDPTRQPTADEALPPRAVDVVVVGGGIVGVATAIFLAQSGLRACVCEKGQLGAEQSSRNWGWVRQMGRDPAETPLAIESLRIWGELDARFNIQTGFRRTGIVYVCRTRREERLAETWIDTARTHDLALDVVEANRIPALLPGIATGFRLAVHTASDGRAEPALAVPALAKAARALGVRVVENCAVRGVERSAGRVTAAVTEHGTIGCSNVVVAGGAWSRLFLGNLGVGFPQLKVLGTAARLETSGRVTEMPVGGGDFSFRRRLDGGFTIALRNTNIAPLVPDSFRLFPQFLPSFIQNWSELKLRVGRRFLTELAMPRSWPLDRRTPFEDIRVLDPAPVEGFNRRARAALIRAFPTFAESRIDRSWAGLIDATPDGVPVIDAVSDVPGLYLASGFSGHGFGIGPGAGLLMAQLLTGAAPCVDPSPFRFGRFARGRRASADRTPAHAGQA